MAEKQQLARGNDAKVLITLLDPATKQPVDVSVFDRIDVFLGRKGSKEAVIRWSSADDQPALDPVTIEDGEGEISVIINRDDTFGFGDFEYYYTVKCWKSDEDYRAGNCAVSSEPVFLFESVTQFDSISGE